MIDTIVTGSSGFIGSHLMKRLPNAKALKHQDIVPGHSYNADQLFFLSTYGNMANHSGEYSMIKANVMDLWSILKNYPLYVVYMSSSSVTLSVQTSYSRSKRASEEILQAFSEIKSCIVRPYSVTGVGEQKEHLIPTLIRSCMEGAPMDFDASPVHDFVDVGDVVDALIFLSDNKITGIIELGSGIPHTNQEVLEIVEEVCGKKANIQSHRTFRDYDNTEWYSRKPFGLQGMLKPLRKSIEEMVEAYMQGLVIDKQVGYRLR